MLSTATAQPNNNIDNINQELQHVTEVLDYIDATCPSDSMLGSVSSSYRPEVSALRKQLELTSLSLPVALLVTNVEDIAESTQRIKNSIMEIANESEKQRIETEEKAMIEAEREPVFPAEIIQVNWCKKGEVVTVTEPLPLSPLIRINIFRGTASRQGTSSTATSSNANTVNRSTQ